MNMQSAHATMDRRERDAYAEAGRPEAGGGAAILDLALCLILAVAVTGLLVLAL